MSSDEPLTHPEAAVGPTQMSVEVAQQPEAVARTLAHLRPARADLARLAAGRRRVLLVARGSSDNAAVYGRYLLETHSLWSAALAAPSVATLYRSDLDLSDAIVVSVSQSGATEEIVEAQAWATRHGAATVAVTNDGDSPLAAAADVALVTQAGVERAVPATKTYTTQLTAMAVLASALSGDPGVLDDALDRVPAEIAGLIERRAGIDEAVDSLFRGAEVLVSGRGLVFGTALEIALKLEETCLRPVRGLSYADLRTARWRSSTRSSSPCWWRRPTGRSCRGCMIWPTTWPLAAPSRSASVAIPDSRRSARSRWRGPISPKRSPRLPSWFRVS